MAILASNNRQTWFPAVSKNPTPEEIYRHLTQIYRALSDHDSAIVQLHGKISPPPASQKNQVKKFKLP